MVIRTMYCCVRIGRYLAFGSIVDSDHYSMHYYCICPRTAVSLSVPLTFLRGIRFLNKVELREAREAQAARDQEASAAVECLAPELAREDADSGHQLAGEKIRLEEEVLALRVQVERLSVASAGGKVEDGAASAPGSPADGQRPAVDETAVTAAKNSTSSESNGDDVPAEDAGDCSSSGRSGGEGGGLTRRLVEAETERVLAELRANPPASTKALMLARAELDARATEVVAKLNATGLLPPPPPLPSALHEDLGL